MEETTIFERFGVEYKQIGDVLVPDIDTSPEDYETAYSNAGKYGRLWILHMSEYYPKIMRYLSCHCEIEEIVTRVEKEAQDLIWEIVVTKILQHKFEKPDSGMERWQFYEHAKQVAEEMGIHDKRLE